MRRLEVEDALQYYTCESYDSNQNADLEKVERKTQIGFCRHRQASQLSQVKRISTAIRQFSVVETKFVGRVKSFQNSWY